jgi:hypothetical protein
MSEHRLVVYVDVDDTLVRSVGSKRIPIPAAIEHVKDLAGAGILETLSSGAPNVDLNGYGRAVSVRIEIARGAFKLIQEAVDRLRGCLAAFDDQRVEPFECQRTSDLLVAAYRAAECVESVSRRRE